jgi:hypothetical protein
MIGGGYSCGYCGCISIMEIKQWEKDTEQISMEAISSIYNAIGEAVRLSVTNEKVD